jgi:hypothetical protein
VRPCVREGDAARTSLVQDLHLQQEKERDKRGGGGLGGGGGDQLNRA